MVKALDDRHTKARPARQRDWRKAMSDNVALALIVYTVLQIFFTVKAMTKGLPSIMPYLALILLVAAIIPACRWFERRWLHIGDDAAHDPGLLPAFRRDQLLLWSIAILLPGALTGLFYLMFA